MILFRTEVEIESPSRAWVHENFWPAIHRVGYSGHFPELQRVWPATPMEMWYWGGAMIVYVYASIETFDIVEMLKFGFFGCEVGFSIGEQVAVAYE